MYTGPVVDDVFRASSSGNLQEMISVLDHNTTLSNRHYLLMHIVDQAYKARNSTENAAILRQVAEMHLKEFHTIKQALLADLNGMGLPHVTTYQKYATFLTENGEFEKAIAVCEEAIAHGLYDGTISNYKGRIERIKKKMSAIPPV